jgi:hypothetical protein
LPVKLVGKKSSQGIGLGASPVGGDIFFAPLTETAIAQYNPKTNEQRWAYMLLDGWYDNFWHQFLFNFRTLAFDYERLQFVADFKTTSKDPNALYCVSSRFHKFFLKNINPNEINTRILRINGIIPSSYSQGYPGFNEISHNNLYPSYLPQQPSYSLQPSSQQFSIPPPVTQRPYPFYNYVNVPQKSYFPTSPSYSSPFAGYHQGPFRTSYYNFRGPASFSYESFQGDHGAGASSPVNYPFQQLNAGESLPQFRDYRQNRFVRNPAKNFTSIYWKMKKRRTENGTTFLRFTKGWKKKI